MNGPAAIPGGRVPLSHALAATLTRAADYARSQSHGAVTLEHVLLALTEDEDAVLVLESSQVDLARLRNDVAQFLGQQSLVGGPPGSQPAPSPELLRILDYAAAAARQSRRSQINGAIVLAAMVGDGRSMAASFLKAHGLTFEAAIRAIQQSMVGRRPPPGAAAQHEEVEEVPEPPRTVSDPQSGIQETVPPPIAGTAPSTEAALARARERVEASRPARPVSSPAPVPVPAPPEPVGVQEITPDEAHEPAPSALPAPPPVQERAPPVLPSGVGRPVGPREPIPAPIAAAPPPAEPIHEELSDDEADDGAAGVAVPPEPVTRAEPPSRSERPAPVVATPAIPPPMPAPQVSAPAGVAPPPLPSRSLPVPPLAEERQGPPPIGARPAMPPPPPPAAMRPPLPGAPQRNGGPVTAPWPQTTERQAPPVPPPYLGAGDTIAGPPFPEPDSVPPARPRPVATGRAKAPDAIKPGQLVENIPRRMKVGVTQIAEVRISRDELADITSGMQGEGPARRHLIQTTRAMSVRLRSSSGGFRIESLSPETQWADSTISRLSADYAVWRFAIMPDKRGAGELLLTVAARTIAGDGIVAETALPEQTIKISVSTNYNLVARRWAGWAAAAILGGVLAKLGETFWEPLTRIVGQLFNF